MTDYFYAVSIRNGSISIKILLLLVIQKFGVVAIIYLITLPLENVRKKVTITINLYNKKKN